MLQTTGRNPFVVCLLIFCLLCPASFVGANISEPGNGNDGDGSDCPFSLEVSGTVRQVIEEHFNGVHDEKSFNEKLEELSKLTAPKTGESTGWFRPYLYCGIALTGGAGIDYLIKWLFPEPAAGFLSKCVGFVVPAILLALAAPVLERILSNTRHKGYNGKKPDKNLESIIVYYEKIFKKTQILTALAQQGRSPSQNAVFNEKQNLFVSLLFLYFTEVAKNPKNAGEVARQIAIDLAAHAAVEVRWTYFELFPDDPKLAEVAQAVFSTELVDDAFFAGVMKAILKKDKELRPLLEPEREKPDVVRGYRHLLSLWRQP